jgi:hypothetical protein
MCGRTKRDTSIDANALRCASRRAQKRSPRTLCCSRAPSSWQLSTLTMPSAPVSRPRLPAPPAVALNAYATGEPLALHDCARCQFNMRAPSANKVGARAQAHSTFATSVPTQLLCVMTPHVIDVCVLSACAQRPRPAEEIKEPAAAAPAASGGPAVVWMFQGISQAPAAGVPGPAAPRPHVAEVRCDVVVRAPHANTGQGAAHSSNPAVLPTIAAEHQLEAELSSLVPRTAMGSVPEVDLKWGPRVGTLAGWTAVLVSFTPPGVAAHQGTLHFIPSIELPAEGSVVQRVVTARCTIGHKVTSYVGVPALAKLLGPAMLPRLQAEIVVPVLVNVHPFVFPPTSVTYRVPQVCASPAPRGDSHSWPRPGARRARTSRTRRFSSSPQP